LSIATSLFFVPNNLIFIMKLRTKQHTIIADTLTPVSIYLKLRDLYPNAILLESNLNEKREKSHSFICLNPISTLTVTQNNVNVVLNGAKKSVSDNIQQTPALFSEFMKSFQIEGDTFQAVFGHTNYNAISIFETLELKEKPLDDSIPLMSYSFYQHVIAIDHFTNELTFTEFIQPNQISDQEQLIERVQSLRFSSYPFRILGNETCCTNPDEFLSQIEKGKKHCQLGDVFQLVLSRRFKQKFNGDDFQVYRALRSINPSPYLYFFDMGNYKIFGSSPEAQIKIESGNALINPIAGTYKRTGNLEQDLNSAEALKADEKENSEHVMLVDLARNDLGKVGENVAVKTFKQIQFFSHVIHMVSEVEAKLPLDSNPLEVFGKTFPAGTLSGAPKYRAMELIDQYEPVSRNYYGGGIGFVELNGNLNHAIMIRSFLSQNNELHYQAGAGVVVNSTPESELKEVDNKIGALRMAIKKAEDIE